MRELKGTSAFWLAGLLFVLLIARQAVAAEPPPATINLAALEELASEHNPTQRLARANLEAAQGRHSRLAAGDQEARPHVAGFVGWRDLAEGAPFFGVDDESCVADQ